MDRRGSDGQRPAVLPSLLDKAGGCTPVCQPAPNGGWQVLGFAEQHSTLRGYEGQSDIYLAVNPVDPVRVRARNPHGRGSKSHRELTAYRAFHCEMDIGKPGYPPDLESALEVIASLPVEPSVIVFTGGGIHGWWVLDDPILLTPDDNAAWERVLRIEQQWKSLICGALMSAGYTTEKGHAGIDRGTFDLTRVLRLPGTSHGRRGVRIEEIGGTGELVSARDLLDALPDLPTPGRTSRKAGNGRATTGPSGRVVEDDDVLAFLQQHSTEPTCAYGRTAARNIVESMRGATERHPEAVKEAIRLIGLMATGCCWAGDVLALRDAFFDIKPEADDAEWNDILCWAVQHHDPDEKGCDMHTGSAPPERDSAVPVTLEEAHRVFRKWLGEEYDTDALDICLAALAVQQLAGDPLWVLIVSGSGNAKTETVSACATGAVMVSTISSAGALLSATSAKERADDATGGLLRRLEPDGVLIIKDVTSILSMDRNARGEVLAALREVYDGSWTRTVGVDGGRTLEWRGRVTVIGAVTTAWDTAHAVIAAMGDRFVLLRLDSNLHRLASGRQAIGNTGSEDRMRAELAAAAAGVIAGMDATPAELVEEEMDLLLTSADLVTRARTAVEFDQRGDVVDAHAPEMPTRFAKQLAQIVRGGLAIGMDRGEALALAQRAARDSLPPMRLAIIADLAAHPDSTTTGVRRRIGKPRTSVDRQLQALHVLGIVRLEEDDEAESDPSNASRRRWRYTLAADVDPTAIGITRNVTTPTSTIGADG